MCLSQPIIDLGPHFNRGTEFSIQMKQPEWWHGARYVLAIPTHRCARVLRTWPDSTLLVAAQLVLDFSRIDCSKILVYILIFFFCIYIEGSRN